MGKERDEDRAASEVKVGWGLLDFILRMHIAFIEAVLRKEGTLGDRHLGFQAVFAPFYLVFWGAYSHEPGVFAAIACFYLGACAWQTAARKRREKQGLYNHSRCVGNPMFWGYKGEIAIMVVVGAVFMPFLQGLAAYCLVGAGGLAYTQAMIAMRQQSEDRSMVDAKVEYEQMQQRWRQRNF
jgi:hypothetical protein